MHTGIFMRMHTGIKQIPVCIQGLHENPRGDYMLSNPLMHTGIFMQSLYAYGDFLDPCMHTRIAIKLRMHMGIT